MFIVKWGKRGGNDFYQQEKWIFLAEEVGNNAMLATTSSPFYMVLRNGKTTGQRLSELENNIKSKI